jgi:phage protein D
MSSDVMAIGRRIMVLLGFGDSEQVPYARWTVSHPKVTGRPTKVPVCVWVASLCR